MRPVTFIVFLWHTLFSDGLQGQRVILEYLENYDQLENHSNCPVVLQSRFSQTEAVACHASSQSHEESHRVSLCWAKATYILNLSLKKFRSSVITSARVLHLFVSLILLVESSLTEKELIYSTLGPRFQLNLSRLLKVALLSIAGSTVM